MDKDIFSIEIEGVQGSQFEEMISNIFDLDTKKMEQLANQGDLNAQMNLGSRLYFGVAEPRDEQKALEWWTKAAQKGNVGSQVNLGNHYSNLGDYKTAIKWWMMAAEQGDAGAQLNVGTCFENGNGVEKDINKAIEYYKKSALQGNKVAYDYLQDFIEDR